MVTLAEEWVEQATMSADGNRVVTINGSRAVRVWDVQAVIEQEAHKQAAAGAYTIPRWPLVAFPAAIALWAAYRYPAIHELLTLGGAVYIAHRAPVQKVVDKVVKHKMAASTLSNTSKFLIAAALYTLFKPQDKSLMQLLFKRAESAPKQKKSLWF